MISSPRSFRQGFWHGILGRDSKNPYGFDKPLSMAGYNNGYSIGKQRHVKDKITLRIEEAL